MLGSDVELWGDGGGHTLLNSFLLSFVRHIFGEFSFEYHASRRQRGTDSFFALESLVFRDRTAFIPSFFAVGNVRIAASALARLGPRLPGESSVVSVGFSRDRDIRDFLSGPAFNILLLVGVRAVIILLDNSLHFLLGPSC